MARRFFVPIVAFLCLCLGSTHSFAEERSISVLVDTDLEPTEASVLLLSAQCTIQKPTKLIGRNQLGQIQVTFSYDSKEVRPDTVASAIVRTAAGDVAFGFVKSLSEQTLDTVSLPTCDASEGESPALESQVGLIRSLVQVRTARREIVQKKLAAVMAEDFLETMKKLERGFGLVYSSELSSELPPSELVDRLSRLLNAVTNYRNRRVQQGSGSS